MIESHIRRHFTLRRLSDETVDQILAATPRNRWYWLSIKFRYAVATAICLFAVILLQGYIKENAIASKLLSDIRFTNENNLTLDFESVPSALEEAVLPFEEKFHLLGGRYCNIDGELAAHLRLIEKETGESLSLYVVKLTPDLDKLLANPYVQPASKIKLWKEGGLFFALKGGE